MVAARSPGTPFQELRYRALHQRDTQRRAGGLGPGAAAEPPREERDGQRRAEATAARSRAVPITSVSSAPASTAVTRLTA